MSLFSSFKHRIVAFKQWFSSLKRWKKIGLIILGCIVVFLCTSPLRTKKTPIETAIVTKETVIDTVSVSGNIATGGETDVPSTTTGVIQKLFVGNGDTVISSQKLFEVKATATPQDKATAYANYLASKAVLNADTATLFSLQSTMYSAWKKYTDLSTNSTYQNADSTPNIPNRVLTEFTTAQDNWFAGEANYKNQQSIIAKDRALLESSTIAYQATRDVVVTAPIGGIIENLSYRVGDTVTVPTSSVATTTTAPPVLYIVHNSAAAHIIKVQVNEVDFPKLNRGQKATITFPAIQNTTFTGSVVDIDAVGTNTSGVITFNAYIQVDPSAAPLAANMTANVMIETARHTQVLTVPNAAIKPYKGGKAVQLYDPKNPGKPPKLVPVLVGIKGIDTTEIISGVPEGTVVVISTGTPIKTATGGFGG